MKTNVIATINQISVLVIDDGAKFVPIKPICNIIGIDTDSQRKKIKDDIILGSESKLIKSTAADGKQREMFCLPAIFILGWLFTINPKNVTLPEAAKNVTKYKKECYELIAGEIFKVND